MSDLISREAAIEVCDWWQHEYDESASRIDDIISWVAEGIKNLPTAERVGKWIEVKNKWGGLMQIICSECGAQVPRDGWGNAMQSDYCYRCGARMEGEEDE